VRRLISLCIIALVMLFSAGCSCLQQACQPYGPKVTGDGTGGAIAVYEDIKGGNQHDFYVQKISPEGDMLWGDKGVLIGSAYKQCDSFHELHIVSDGSGGAIVTWSGYLSEPDWKLPPGQRQIEYLTHITRVDSDGSIMWKREVIAVDHMISDGAGGAIIATDYSYDERGLFVIKIDPEGNFPWGGDGVNVRREGYCDHTLGLASDGSGGAIFIWQELQTEPGAEPHQPKTTDRIFAQKIDAGGNLAWGDEAILLYTTPEGVYGEEPKAIDDGSGGAIAVWMQVPEGKVEYGTPKALMMDLYVQRVDAEGKCLWADNGIPLEISKAVEWASPHTPLVVTDGAGGAIIVWEDLRKGFMSMYAQKIDADGNLRWQPGGAEVCYIETHSSFWPRLAVSDGSGGAIVTYSNRAQKIDADGRTMWPGDGVLFTESGTHDLAYDGHGGAIIAWGIGKSMFKSERSYVQRIDSGGKLLWGEEGVKLNP
jgi:hypothetical protein